MATGTLMQRYTEYNDRLKAKGIKLITFACPSCGQSIETGPAPEGDVWDTLSDCPHCNAMFMKVTEGKKAYGLIPEAPPQYVDLIFQDGRTESVDVSKAEHVLELGGFAPKI